MDVIEMFDEDLGPRVSHGEPRAHLLRPPRQRHHSLWECPRGDVHTPQWETRWQVPGRGYTMSFRDIRCTKCGTRRLHPSLLAPLAPSISSHDLSLLLAAHFCSQGHQFLSTRLTPDMVMPRAVRPAAVQVAVCIMCGKLHNPRHPYPGRLAVLELTQLLGAGISDADAADISARAPLREWRGDYVIHS